MIGGSGGKALSDSTGLSDQTGRGGRMHVPGRKVLKGTLEGVFWAIVLAERASPRHVMGVLE